ncbi:MULTISPECIES: VOC family protein [unclassified Enterococcus]|jgi:lactoylglutathione lyase|uniref:VOC family protein n=1 Tax=unclassified Enterococcus TaxID=2608891 RepID=UPI000353A311|nr:glyoxalase family protein [Enterococcus faecalis 13-SD-W-01]
MFTNEVKIMLYVDDVEANSNFWQSIGFTELERVEMEGTLIIEIGASENAQAKLVLYDREFIEQHSPEVASNSPSLMFHSEAIFDLYKTMKENNVTVGEMVQLGEEYVFNFSDPDGNYFAVTGK